MKRKLIGIAGKARSGKDTIGTNLMLNHGFHRMAFADPLKLAMAATFGLPVHVFHVEDEKARVDPVWGVTRRWMLQEGADALRQHFGQDLWIRRWAYAYLDLAESEHVVVTDIRSNAEAEAVRKAGGRVLHLVRPGAGLAGTEGAHHTESGVDILEGETLITNDGTVEDLLQQVSDFLKE